MEKYDSDEGGAASELRNNVRENLRYIFHTGGSISRLAKELEINRQQVNKYLSGTISPSYAILWRIARHFDILVDDLFVDPGDFPSRMKVVDLKQAHDPVVRRSFDGWINSIGLWAGNPEDYAGKYWLYLPMPGQLHKTMKAFVRLYYKDHRMLVGLHEIYVNNDFYLKSVLVRKQVGAANVFSNRLFILTYHLSRQEDFPNSYLEYYVFYPRLSKNSRFLSGKVMGVENHGFREVYVVDAVLEFLGNSPTTKRDLETCGVFERDHVNVPDIVRDMFDGK